MTNSEISMNLAYLLTNELSAGTYIISVKAKRKLIGSSQLIVQKNCSISSEEKLEQKDGRSLDLNLVSGFLMHLSFACVSSGRLRRPSVSLRRDLFPLRGGFVLDSPSQCQGKNSC